MPFVTQGKTNLKYILIVVILAVIAGGGILSYYYSWIKELETKLAEMELRLPEVKPSEDETANWKVFTNSTFDYSIKYPPGWGFERMKGRDEVVLIDTEDRIGVPRGESKIIIVVRSYVTDPLIKDTAIYGEKFEVERKSYELAGILGEQVVFLPGGFKIATAVARNGKTYIISFLRLGDKNYLNIYDQMLSTFEFLE